MDHGPPPDTPAAAAAPPTFGFRVSETIAAPPAAVYAMLADADHWKDWAGPLVGRSGWDDNGVPAGSVGSVRRLGRPPAVSREEIVVADPPTHHGYVARSGIPVRSYRADVSLTRSDGGGTHLEWTGTLVPSVPRTGPLLGWILGRTVAGFARRLRAAAETAASRPRR